MRTKGQLFVGIMAILFALQLLPGLLVAGEGFLDGEGPRTQDSRSAYNRMFGSNEPVAGDAADLEMVRFLLAKERNITVEQHGGKIILDGRVTSESVRNRIDKLRATFKNLLDLTEYLQEEDSILADAALIKKKIESRLNSGYVQEFSFAPKQVVDFEVVNNDIIIMGDLNNENDLSTAEQIAKTYNPKVVNHLMVRNQSIELSVIFARVTYSANSRIGMNPFHPTIVTMPSMTWSSKEGNEGSSFAGMFKNRRWTASELVVDPNGESGETWLNLMANDGDASILARPHLTALNGTPARFVSGGERMVFNTVGDTATTEYKEYGFILETTPTLTSDGRIHLLLKMTFLTPVDGTDDFIKFEHSSAAIISANQGLALSGIIREIYSRNLDGVPGLRRVPLLRNFFSVKGKHKDNEELVVMAFPLIPKNIIQAPYVDSSDTTPMLDKIISRKSDHIKANSYEADKYVPVISIDDFPRRAEPTRPIPIEVYSPAQKPYRNGR